MHRGHRGNRGCREAPGANRSPIPPMPPMPFLLAGLFERIRSRAPFPGRCLPGEDKAGHANARQLFGLGCDILTTPPLRVQSLLHVVVELAHGDRMVMVLVPPDSEQVGDNLPVPVALLRLANALDGVLTT